MILKIVLFFTDLKIQACKSFMALATARNNSNASGSVKQTAALEFDLTLSYS